MSVYGVCICIYSWFRFGGISHNIFKTFIRFIANIHSEYTFVDFRRTVVRSC